MDATSPEELDDDLHARIAELSEEAKSFEEDGEWDADIGKLKEALALIPDPKYNWEASTWLFAGIGDDAFQAGQYEQARDALREAMLCPGAIDNPFIHLRRGETLFELGDMKGAEDALARAYMLEGSDIFEEEDPKYFDHLKTVLKPPPGGVW